MMRRQIVQQFETGWFRRLRRAVRIGRNLLFVVVMCAGFVTSALFVTEKLLAKSPADPPLRHSQMSELISQLPRLAEIYERKVTLAVKEADLPVDAVETSPTLLAVRGVMALHSGNVAAARGYADRLQARSERRGGGLFFAFPWSYETVWPYKLRAPWISALTQGFALTLFDGLVRAEQRLDDKETARAIARSFLVPISEGGVLRETASGAVFEEYPLPISTLVLNGAAIATLALSDHAADNPDSVFAGLLERCRIWWRANIDRFIVYSPTYAVPVSAYSLAPMRKEVLFRFLHKGIANIGKIELVKANGDTKTLDVGGPGDASRSGEAFIWLNRKFQNWGEAVSASGRHYRPIMPKQGEYDHAPFSFSVSKEDLQAPLTLGIEIVGSTDEPVIVQVYDGVEYIGVKDIAADDHSGVSRMALPLAALTRLSTDDIALPPVEPAYFAENMLYIRQLGQALGLKELTAASALWEPSARLTPAQFDARRPQGLLQVPPSVPVLPVKENSLESIHAEYPSVIRYGDALAMFYAGIGSDNRWRLFMATSTDNGRSWVRQGGVLGEEAQPQKGAAAFPSVVYDDEQRLYRLFWAVDMDGNGTYDTILSAESTTLWNWRRTPMRLAAQGLGLKVKRQAGEWSMSYSERAGDHTIILVSRRSSDAISWSAATSRETETGVGQSGLYTHERMEMDGRRLWIIDKLLGRDRMEWQLFCEIAGADRLIPVLDEPVHVSEPGADRWDQHRYGMNILEEAGRPGRFAVYYNGIRTDRGDGNGMIGRAELHLDHAMLSKISSRCSKLQ
jgi:hypothetical protein